MKKRRLVKALSMLLALLMLTMVGCGTSNPSDTKYWFSNSSKNFVAYDEETNNISEAGSYWNFTVAKNVEITMNLIINVDNFYSGAYLYVNGTQVKSEVDTGIHTYVYKLSLKKGDEIKIHAFWTNSLKVNENGFEILMMSIKQGEKTYVLKEYDNLK